MSSLLCTLLNHILCVASLCHHPKHVGLVVVQLIHLGKLVDLRVHLLVDHAVSSAGNTLAARQLVGAWRVTENQHLSHRTSVCQGEL